MPAIQFTIMPRFRIKYLVSGWTLKRTSFVRGRNRHSGKDPLTPIVPGDLCLSGDREDFDAGNQNDNPNERNLLHAMLLTIL